MSKVTKELLEKLFPLTSAAKRNRFVAPFNNILPKYDITTKDRFATFIANVGIESDRLKTLREYGTENYFTKYNGRKNLGNVRLNDGVMYLGRSVLQTTGRYNYWRVVVAYLKVLTGKNWHNSLAETDFDAYLKTDEYNQLLKEADKHNVNFLAHPEMLETFPHGVEAAGIFVKDNNLNKYADKGKDGFYAYAGILNRGSYRKKANHYDERLELYKLAMRVIPNDFDLSVDDEESVSMSVVGVPEIVENKETAVEVSHTSSEQTADGTVSQTVETKNEQDVNVSATVGDTKPYGEAGFIATLKKDLLAVGGGNIGFEGLTRFLEHAAGVPEWLTGFLIWVGWALLIVGGIWLGFRLIHFAFYRWDGVRKRDIETMVKTDTSRKDVEWK